MKLDEIMLTQWVPGLINESMISQLAFASVVVCAAACVVWLGVALFRVQSHRTKAILWLTVLIVPMLSLAMVNAPPLFSLDIASQGEEILPLAPRDSAVASLLVKRPVVASEINKTPIKTTRAPRTNIPFSLSLTSIWGIIVGLFVGRLFLDVIRRSYLQCHTSPADEHVSRTWEAQLKRLAISRENAPELLVTTRLESPALVGCTKPIVFIPEWLTRHDDATMLEWTMRHELMHWKHKDHWGNGVRRIIEALFFFHPVVWWVSNKWASSAELACDRSVITSQAEVEEYTDELYSMITRIHRRKRMLMSSGLFASRSQIIERIKALTRNPLSSSGSMTPVGRVAALSILVAVFMASGVAIESGSSREIDVRTEIDACNRELEDLWNSGDYEGVLAMYSEGFIAVPEISEPITDRNAYRKILAEEVNVYPNLKHATTSLKVQGDYAYEIGVGTYQETDPEVYGPTEREDYLFVWKREHDGVWYIHRAVWWGSYFDSPKTSAVRTQLDARIAELTKAWNSRNLEGVLAIYDEGAIATSESAVHMGDRDAFRKAVASEMQDSRGLVYVMNTLTAPYTDNYAYEMGVGSYTYTGEESKDMRGKKDYMNVWKKDDNGVWNIHVEIWWGPKF